MKLKFLVEKESLVKEYILEKGISRNLGRKIKLYGKIRINGVESGNWFPVRPGDFLEIELPEKENPEIPVFDAPLEIAYEDENVLIVNKPANLSTQPTRKHPDNLISRVKAHYLKNGIAANVHVATRLDYATSGLVLVAKTGHMHNLLQRMEVEKTYLAVAQGHFEEKSGAIDLPIKRLEGDRLRRRVAADGKPALTEYRVLEEGADSTLLELKLRTGRCHQIRVHLAALGHPVLGDKLYGAGGELLHLHAFRLRFFEPLGGKVIDVAKAPDWLQDFAPELHKTVQ